VIWSKMHPEDASKMWTSLLYGTFCIVHMNWFTFLCQKKNSVIYAKSIRCHCATFEGQTALSCVKKLDKLRHIYCMWHHKVAMLLLRYSSLCVTFSNTDFKTFLIKQFYKHNHFRCSNSVKEPAISHLLLSTSLKMYTAGFSKQLVTIW